MIDLNDYITYVDIDRREIATTFFSRSPDSEVVKTSIPIGSFVWDELMSLHMEQVINTYEPKTNLR